MRAVESTLAENQAIVGLALTSRADSERLRSAVMKARPKADSERLPNIGLLPSSAGNAVESNNGVAAAVYCFVGESGLRMGKVGVQTGTSRRGSR